MLSIYLPLATVIARRPALPRVAGIAESIASMLSIYLVTMLTIAKPAVLAALASETFTKESDHD
jgi:hypothetical protein